MGWRWPGCRRPPGLHGLILGAAGLIAGQAPPLWLVSSLGLTFLLGVGLAPGHLRMHVITALAAGAAGIILAKYEATR